MREWILQFDPCSWCIIAAAAWVVAHKVQEQLPQYRFKLRWVFGVAFLATIVFGYVGMRPDRGDEMLSVLIAGFFFANVAELLAALILPATDSIAARISHRLRTQRWQREQSEKAEQEAEQRRLAAEQQAAEDERLRPERERQARERLVREQAEAEAQRRRDAARSECLVFYLLHEAEIKSRFPRKRYNEYVATYLRDAMPPDEVEAQAQKLLAMIQGHLEKAGVAHRRLDLAALGQWLQDGIAEIEAQPIDDRLRRNQLARLKKRYADLTQQYFEEVQP